MTKITLYVIFLAIVLTSVYDELGFLSRKRFFHLFVCLFRSNFSSICWRWMLRSMELSSKLLQKFLWILLWRFRWVQISSLSRWILWTITRPFTCKFSLDKNPISHQFLSFLSVSTWSSSRRFRQNPISKSNHTYHQMSNTISYRAWLSMTILVCQRIAIVKNQNIVQTTTIGKMTGTVATIVKVHLTGNQDTRLIEILSIDNVDKVMIEAHPIDNVKAMVIVIETIKSFSFNVLYILKFYVNLCNSIQQIKYLLIEYTFFSRNRR